MGHRAAKRRALAAVGTSRSLDRGRWLAEPDLKRTVMLDKPILKRVPLLIFECDGRDRRASSWR